MQTGNPGRSADGFDLKKIVQLDKPPLEAKIGLQPQELVEFGISCSLNGFFDLRLRLCYQKKSFLPIPTDIERPIMV